MTTPTPRLEEIRQREQKATKGPWHWVGWNYDGDFEKSHYCGWLTTEKGRNYGDVIGVSVWSDPVCASVDPPDAAFIAHAREDIPFLLDRVSDLEGRLEKAKGALLDISGFRLCTCSDYDRCQSCLAEKAFASLSDA